MFDDNDSESPLYGRQSEILSTLLTQLKKEGKNISSEAKDIHLKQITRIIRQFIDIADAFRASNVNALKSGRIISKLILKLRIKELKIQNK